MSEYPNLAGIATENLVSQIGTGSYSASYINWARTMQLLREHAPGWLPELVQAADGGIVHRSPVGAYLFIRFTHSDGRTTPPVPQSIMDNRNVPVPFDKINSRDVTDTHRRGICLAAALTFGLAYELWAKMPLESGYAAQDERPVEPTAEELRKIKHDEALTVWQESVDAIKVAIEKDDAYTVRELWSEITDAAKIALWIAPSKGGTFSAAERDYIKNMKSAEAA